MQAIAGILLAVTFAVESTPVCGAWPHMAEAIRRSTNETPQQPVKISPGMFTQLFRNDSEWTLILIDLDAGKSCVIGFGKNWPVKEDL